MRAPWADARLRAGAVAALVLGVVALWWSGALGAWLEPGRMRAFLTETGLLGPLVWLVAFAVLQPFGTPGALFLIPASLVWPPGLAIALCVAGAVGAGLVAFALAHWIGRDAIVARLPERLRRAAERAQRGGFRGVLLVRLVFFLFPPAHWALGVSGIRPLPLVTGSALGFLPGVVVWVLLTREAARELEGAPAWKWLALGALAALSLAGFAWWRRRRHRSVRTWG